MRRFQNILVVYDMSLGGGVGSEDALEQAVTLARQNGAKLSVAALTRDGRSGPVHVREAEKRLDRLADGLRYVGLANVVILFMQKLHYTGHGFSAKFFLCHGHD